MVKQRVKNEKGASSFKEAIERKYGKDFGVKDDNELIRYLNSKGYGALARVISDDK